MKSVIVLTLLLASGSLFADTLVLKNGRTYRNVKSVNRGDRLFIVFSNGRTRGFPRSAVKSLTLRKVSWKRGMSAGRVRSLVDEAVRNSVRDEVKKAFAEKKREDEIRARESEKARRINESKAQAARERRNNALWRSALLPGWGQFYSGRENRAYIFGSAALVSFAYYLNQHSTFTTAQRDYDDSGLPAGLLSITGVGGPANFIYFEDRKAVLNRAETAVNRAFFLMAALWSLNLWEVYANSNIQLSIAPEHMEHADGKPAVRVGYTLRF